MSHDIPPRPKARQSWVARHSPVAPWHPLAIAVVAGFVIVGSAELSHAAAPAASEARSTDTRSATGPASRPAGASTAASRLVVQNRIVGFLEKKVSLDPDDNTALNRLADEYLKRYRETGDDRDLGRSADAAARSLKSVAVDLNPAALAARAKAAQAVHRFAAARDDARALVAADPGKPFAYALLGDALLELGDTKGAADAYAKLVRDDDDDAVIEGRLARLAWMTGDLAQTAERLTAAVVLAAGPPEENRPAQAPEVFAWAHVQAGQFAFQTGKWDEAEQHYQAALTVRPDDWPALDHVAELRAAQKRYPEAVATYENLIARIPRPELMQSLGDVQAMAGDKSAAAAWHAKAAAAYRKAADAGATQYDHHLAGFYADAQPDPAEALKWATKDLAARQSGAAHDGMAWALYQNARYAEAAAETDKALATGTKDSHVLYHASLIYYRAGDSARGRECLMRAAQTNPKFMEFHVHR